MAKVGMLGRLLFAKRDQWTSGRDKKKSRAFGPAKVEVRQLSQNLPEGTADTAASGGRKRCRVGNGQRPYWLYCAAWQCSMPQKRAVRAHNLQSDSNSPPGTRGMVCDWKPTEIRRLVANFVLSVSYSILLPERLIRLSRLCIFRGAAMAPSDPEPV